MNALFDFKKIEKISNALADPNRLAIMEAIRTGNDWLDIFEIIKLSQPATSHHLKVLKQAGLKIPKRLAARSDTPLTRIPFLPLLIISMGIRSTVGWKSVKD